MRNNGRFTAAEENVAMGAHELFEITDRCSRHVNIDFPGHQHASLYDVTKVEPCVRRLLREKGVDIRLMARAVDVVVRKRDMSDGKIAKESIIEKIVLAGERKSKAMFSWRRLALQGQWGIALHMETGAACVY